MLKVIRNRKRLIRNINTRLNKWGRITKNNTITKRRIHSSIQRLNDKTIRNKFYTINQFRIARVIKSKAKTRDWSSIIEMFITWSKDCC